LSLALWYSLLQSSRTLPEFIACAISCPSLLQKYDESIAPSLSQSFAALRSKRYYGQLRLPNRPEGISFPYILPLLPSTAPTRVSRATPPDFPCVSPLLPRKPTSPFWQFSLRPVSQPSPNVHRVGNSFFVITRLLIGSLALRPAGLLDSPKEPLSGNFVLRVTPHTSLQLHGRTAELPWPDLNRQVIRYTRHTDVVYFIYFL
jgi:hypothetical protein